ncbi:unnamed protein product [Larinioides sclopetarius]|uniref:Uncharacterized protein n=1 Tax=Larinioides sclopetarius TaxID=280406 RepID=A0AAV2BK40_9ARAC
MLVLLVLFVLPLSLGQVEQYSPRSEALLQGLEQFQLAAEKQLANIPIPDVRLWKSQRIETNNKLKALRVKLDNVCFYANCGKAAGSGMGILCSLSAFLTFLSNLIGMPFLTPVTSVGVSLCPAAYLTKEATSVMESIYSAKYQNDIQSVLLKDKEVSISLEKWLKFSPHLEMEVQQIFGFDLKSKNSMKFICLNEFCKLLTRFKNFQSALEHMKRGKYSSLLDESIEIDELRKFSKRILDSPIFSNKIRYSLDILNTLIGATNYAGKLTKGYQNILEEKIASAILFLQNNLDIKMPFMIKSSAFILLNVLDLAQEITSLIEETKIIRDGKCPYSDSLKQITDMLEQELKLIESSFPM